MHCLLVGNYGVQNLGDEALKDYFVEAFPDIQWTVLSASPAKGELPRLPGGVRSLFQWKWIRTVRAYRSADAVLFGGGSLWTDVESVYACFLWSLHAAVAFFFRKPVFLAFQGIGPFHTKIGEILARWVVRNAQFVSVRDEASYDRVQGWGRKDVFQTFDPVFFSMSRYTAHPQSKKLCVIIPRHNSSTSMAQVLKTSPAVQNAEEIHILSMQPHNTNEQHAIKQMQAIITMPCSVYPVHTLDHLMQEVSQASHVITERFHGALAALALHVPQTIVTQSDGDKLSALLSAITHNPDSASNMRLLVQKGEEALRRALSQV